MSAGLGIMGAWLRSDDAIRYGVPVIVALLVIGPRVLRRSLRRWTGAADSARRGSPEVAAVVIGALRSRLKRLIRPTFLLVPAPELGFSKLGGDPELPSDVAWPAGDEGPRTFLAQIDLAELQPEDVVGWLPKAGRLYAFYDSERHGCADVVRLLSDSGPPGPAAPTSSPGGRRYAERRVGFALRTSVPSLDWLDLDASELGLTDSDYLDLDAMADAPPADETQHRIGGYPNEIQPERMWLSCEHLARGLPEPVWGEQIPPAIQRAAKQWRLLLQIDSDDALKMNFGDGGRLYIFIRARHARAGDFSKTVSLWQTY